MQNRFSFRQRLRSFRYAFNGLLILIREEHNARIHITAAILAIVAGFSLRISIIEWAVIMILIGFVITLEIYNTVIEQMADFISPEKHDKIKKMKDLAAAGVLIGSGISLLTGIIIFLPRILEKF